MDRRKENCLAEYTQESESEWTKVKRGRKNELEKQYTPPVHTSNKYAVLESLFSAEPFLSFTT